jgi:hypothetical protein
MAARHRFEVTQHLLRIIGICAQCQRANRARGSKERSTTKHRQPTVRGR